MLTITKEIPFVTMERSVQNSFGLIYSIYHLVDIKNMCMLDQWIVEDQEDIDTIKGDLSVLGVEFTITRR